LKYTIATTQLKIKNINKINEQCQIYNAQCANKIRENN